MLGVNLKDGIRRDVMLKQEQTDRHTLPEVVLEVDKIPYGLATCSVGMPQEALGRHLTDWVKSCLTFEKQEKMSLKSHKTTSSVSENVS